MTHAFEKSVMKAITISQPYASLIANGEKFVENRVWETKYRGPIAIHAGKGTQYLTKKEIEISGVPVGKVVAIAELTGCVKLSEVVSESVLPPGIDLQKFLEHDHTEGPYCWILEDVRKIKVPFEVVGMQFLWNCEIPLIGLDFDVG